MHQNFIKIIENFQEFRKKKKKKKVTENGCGQNFTFFSVRTAKICPPSDPENELVYNFGGQISRWTSPSQTKDRKQERRCLQIQYDRGGVRGGQGGSESQSGPASDGPKKTRKHG